MHRLHVACASDTGYTPYCATMLQSLLAQHSGRAVTVHFLHTEDCSGHATSALAELVRRHGADWLAHRMSSAQAAELPRMARIPQIMWLRVWLPELLPEAERVLYLDVDTLILEPLDELWETEFNDCLVAAVDNVLEPAMANRPAALGLPAETGYFNSGVLLLNLAQMRREGTTGKILDCARQHGDSLLWPDQDALNLVLGPRRRRLHPRWNCQNSFFYWRDWTVRLIGATQVDEAMSNPGILHFEGPAWAKPWHYLSDHPFRGSWYAQQHATGWPTPRPAGRTLKNFVLRHLPRPAAESLRALLGRPPRPRPYASGRLP